MTTLTQEARIDLRLRCSDVPNSLPLFVNCSELAWLLDAADERDRLAEELAEARAAIRFLWFRVGLHEKYGFDGGYPAEHAAAIAQAEADHG